MNPRQLSQAKVNMCSPQAIARWAARPFRVPQPQTTASAVAQPIAQAPFPQVGGNETDLTEAELAPWANMSSLWSIWERFFFESQVQGTIGGYPFFRGSVPMFKVGPKGHQQDNIHFLGFFILLTHTHFGTWGGTHEIPKQEA